MHLPKCARPDGTEPGDYVRKGAEPVFLCYGKGEYELILNRQHVFEDASAEEGEFDATEGDGEALILGKRGGNRRCPLAIEVDGARVLRIADSEQFDPAAIIVRYLAEEPFQAYYRRKPVGPMKDDGENGWQRISGPCRTGIGGSHAPPLPAFHLRFNRRFPSLGCPQPTGLSQRNC
jgi:hypothetical protein